MIRLVFQNQNQTNNIKTWLIQAKRKKKTNYFVPHVYITSFLNILFHPASSRCRVDARGRPYQAIPLIEIGMRDDAKRDNLITLRTAYLRLVLLAIFRFFLLSPVSMLRHFAMCKQRGREMNGRVFANSFFFSPNVLLWTYLFYFFSSNNYPDWIWCVSNYQSIEPTLNSIRAASNFYFRINCRVRMGFSVEKLSFFLILVSAAFISKMLLWNFYCFSLLQRTVVFGCHSS